MISHLPSLLKYQAANEHNGYKNDEAHATPDTDLQLKNKELKTWANSVTGAK